MRTHKITFIHGENVYRAKMINQGWGWACLTLEANVESCRRVRGDFISATEHLVTSHWRYVNLKAPTERTKLMVKALVDHLNAADTISIVDSVDLTVKEAV